MSSPNLPPVSAEAVVSEVELQAKELGVLPEDLLAAVEAVAESAYLGRGVDQVRIEGGQQLARARAGDDAVREHNSQTRGVLLGERRLQAGLDATRLLLVKRGATS